MSGGSGPRRGAWVAAVGAVGAAGVVVSAIAASIIRGL
jgi:hypothetical protein